MEEYKKLKRVEEVEIQYATNGFIVKFTGDDENNDWKSHSHLTHDIDEVFEIIKIFAESNSLL
jgi:hypothetical protein